MFSDIILIAAILKVCRILKQKYAYLLTRYVRTFSVHLYANQSSAFLVVDKDTDRHTHIVTVLYVSIDNKVYRLNYIRLQV